jgi:alpha-D-xyloside xylohydrolase
MDFRADTNVFGIKDQYLFGPALMPCPVTAASATNRSVYLPSGATWYDFWTGATNAGGQMISAAAAIDTLPIFVRAGSILPYGPDIQYATQSADPIELRVYRGANGSFTLYEDEGDNYNYESGSYATISITWNESTKTLTLGARQGSFPGMLTSRTFRIVWVGAGHGTGITNTTTADVVVTYTGTAQNIVGP